MTRLYELTAHYAAIQEAAEAGEDVGDALALIQDDLTVKAERIACVLRNLTADEDALSAEIKRLTEKRSAVANNRERLREYIKRSMLEAGISKIKCPAFVLSVSDGPECVEVVDADQIPDEFTRVKREPDRTAIMRAYKEHGEICPGAQIVRNPKLTVR